MTSGTNQIIIGKSERDMLKIFRFFLLAFTEGSQTHWETAMSISKGEHGLDAGREIGFALLRVLQSVREARTNSFMFIHPGCEKCASGLLDSERYLMQAIRCVFKGETNQALVPLMLLCEGADIGPVIKRMQELSTYINSNGSVKDNSNPSTFQTK
jgi:hypothetical protein